MIRREGKAAFVSEVHDVVTLRHFILVNSPVRVMEADGVRVAVHQP